MRIAGIDASSNKSGITIFEDGKYVEHVLLDFHKNKDVFERIPMMSDAICKYLDKVGDIDKIIIEKSVLRSNVDTIQKLSNIAGAIMMYAFQNNIVFEHPVPSEWRARIGLQQSSKIKREALKLEAIQAVKQEYGFDVSDDEAESILIARSGFELPQIKVGVEDIDEDLLWG